MLEFTSCGTRSTSKQKSINQRKSKFGTTVPSIAKIAYPMVADPTARLCRYFGTYIEDAGLCVRGTFIIDPEGVLKAMDIHDNSIGQSAEEILRKLQAASFVRQHQGEVCPTSWKPGRKTLKPGLDLVEKI